MGQVASRSESVTRTYSVTGSVGMVLAGRCGSEHHPVRLAIASRRPGAVIVPTVRRSSRFVLKRQAERYVPIFRGTTGSRPAFKPRSAVRHQRRNTGTQGTGTAAARCTSGPIARMMQAAFLDKLSRPCLEDGSCEREQ